MRARTGADGRRFGIEIADGPADLGSGRRSLSGRPGPAPLQAMTDGRLDSSTLRQLPLALAMIIILLLRPRGLWPAPEHRKSLAEPAES